MRRKLLLLLSSVALLFATTTSNAQTPPIKGTVKNDKGIAVPGVTVKIKNTNVGTQTDEAGNFSLPVAPGKTLIFSAVSYETSEVKAQDNLQVVLKEKNNSLTEVIVTANAIKREQRSLGYAAPTIKASELHVGQSSSALTSLSGRVAGLNITSSTGAPGGSTRVVLRGGSSITGNNQALIVIDGVPYDNTDKIGGGSLTAVTFGNRGNDVNPDDIASVTVLAGPAASALYGARASNGALIITTKSGSNSRKAEITVSSTNTFSSVLKLPDFQNQYGQGYYSGVNSDGTLAYNTEDWGDNFSWGAPFTGKVQPWGQTIDGVQQTKPYSATPNNIKNFFSTGFATDNNIGISSGNDKASYYLGLGALNSNGIYPTNVDGYNKYSLRFNGKANLSNNFYTSINFNYTKINSNNVAAGQAGGSALGSLYQTPRDIPIDKMSDLNNKYNGYGYTDANGVYHSDKYGFYQEFYPSPYFLLANYKNYDDVDRATGAFSLGYKPTPWLDVLERVTEDFYSDRRRLLSPKYLYSPADPGTSGNPPAYPAAAIATSNGGYEEDVITNGEFNHDLMVTAKHTFWDDFSGSLMLGNNVRLNNNNLTVTSTNQSSGLIVPGWYNFGNSDGPVLAQNTRTVQRRVSVYGDLGLSWRNMVYVDATARNDWSSTLPVGANSFFYPSVSGAFVFTELLKGSDINRILNYGKVRASWARVGNDALPYLLSTTYSQAQIADGYTGGTTIFPFSGVPGFMINSSLGDPAIKPEITTATEFGTELSFLDSRLSVIANYYTKTSRNQIVSSSVAPSSGYLNSTVNAGTIQNKGVELTLRGTPIKTRNFSLELFGTYTKYKNKVLSLPNHAQIVVGGFNGMAIVAQEGMPYGEFYAVTNQTVNGHTVVGAADGQPVPTSSAVYLGSYDPKYTASLGGTLTYKNWSLGFLFDTKQGGVYYSNTKANADFNGTSLETGGVRDPQIWAGSVINTGTTAQPSYQPNTTARYIKQDYYVNVQPAGMNVVDASYIKLRSLQLEYQVPANTLTRTPFGHASIGVFGNNLFLWTPRSNKYVDPEMNSSGSGNEQGFDFTAQPSVRNYGVDIKLTF
ncbi:SusC/RagA family TonB-linked outer membrane protein [Puia sp.]|jgi:TonB-linked SusC/RagA family outer membrane protein|uniref:SusC/RagA family TonB-linked outer membrane protein n=1 Tax=Puia sp. TaxID=2045100 RepID=UPI002F3F7E36